MTPKVRKFWLRALALIDAAMLAILATALPPNREHQNATPLRPYDRCRIQAVSFGRTVCANPYARRDPRQRRQLLRHH